MSDILKSKLANEHDDADFSVLVLQTGGNVKLKTWSRFASIMKPMPQITPTPASYYNICCSRIMQLIEWGCMSHTPGRCLSEINSGYYYMMRFFDSHLLNY
jgi:hypothetical protein